MQGNVSRPFVLAMVLNLAFVAIEFYYGVHSSSLSLLADAWHNLGDVAGLAISLLALRMATLKPNRTYTYGYSKGTILASLANAVLLLLAVGSISFEAVQRLMNPGTPQWNVMSLVAGLGILVNSGTALLFMRKQELNSRAAFLHMAADALVSLAVVLGGVLLHYTGYVWIDPALSILICAVILYGTWGLLKSSLRLSLDGVPEGVNMQEIHDAAMVIPGVRDIHHLHVWAMSTTKNALTAHIMMEEGSSAVDEKRVRHDFRHALLHLNIQHATLELELSKHEACKDCDAVAEPHVHETA
ncbi:MAG: cation diffusion facilitator family transporter [Bacteroidota bacterium]|jgi:cobalt-zinc-cadmium efflux system protein